MAGDASDAPTFRLVDIPERLEAWREWQGMTCGRMSELSGVQRPVIWKWLTGRSRPTMRTVIRVVDALGITVHELLGETPGERDDRMAANQASIECVRGGLDAASQGPAE